MLRLPCLIGQRIEMILMKIEDKNDVKKAFDNLSIDALDERDFEQNNSDWNGNAIAWRWQKLYSLTMKVQT